MEAQGITMTMKGKFYNTYMGRGEYALINVKHSNVIPKYLIMCIKVGKCMYCNWTIYSNTYTHMQMQIPCAMG
jgi:hypothetical protein